jgi:NADPH:quinone reductase
VWLVNARDVKHLPGRPKTDKLDAVWLAKLLGGADPDSAAFRDQVRPRLIRLAADGDLVVPVARTFPFDEAPAALELLRSGHPGGKLALIP